MKSLMTIGWLGITVLITYKLQGQVFDPAKVRMVWQDPKGKPYMHFQAVRKAFPDIVFAMNAGMYTTDFSPVGLFIEKGKELRPIRIMKDPSVNFGIQPQGVFWLNGKKAGVCAIPCQTKSVTYATQSAPMLVIDGKINPNLPKGLWIPRNGVGIRKDGKLYFAWKVMGFREFARHFIEQGCVNALYLDGNISGRWQKGNPEGSTVRDGPYGPIIVAF